MQQGSQKTHIISLCLWYPLCDFCGESPTYFKRPVRLAIAIANSSGSTGFEICI
jgi:hypothetical protein